MIESAFLTNVCRDQPSVNARLAYSFAPLYL
jgi:hypothetical protein